MHKNLVKNYNALYPTIDLSKGYLSHEDILVILKHKLPNLNPNSEKILSVIKEMATEIRPSQKVFTEFMALIGNGSPGGAITSESYWLKMGWSLEEAKKRVVQEQRRRSKRCVEFWMERGYTENEAREEISKVQSGNSKKWVKGKSKPKSTAQLSYWISRGYSIEDATNEVSKHQSIRSRKRLAKYTQLELAQQNPHSVEYWKLKDPDNYAKLYEEYLHQRYANQYLFRSKIADEFCEMLASHFPSCKIYMKENEFGKYIEGVGYRKYDYVDVTNQVCVEFHGNYWHEEGAERDKIKEDFIKSLGFRYFVVWESEFRTNKQQTVERIVKEIKCVK